MAVTLEEYAATYLPGRNLPWPKPPRIDSPKAKPALKPLKVRAILWTVYGTLLNVPHGEIVFEHEMELVMDAALDKTIQEFKMWQSMSRKPGAPSAYMKELYKKAYSTVKLTGGGGKFPEVISEKIWDDIVKKLFQKEYQIDAQIYGTHDEFLQKLTYFFHASIQGCGAYPNATQALSIAASLGKTQGLLGDGQCFTKAQLFKALREEDARIEPNNLLTNDICVLSHQHRVRKPSETLFGTAVTALAQRGISPSETLHVGSNLERDIAPAKKHGMMTALYAGDKTSLSATPAQLKDVKFRPDVMLTDLDQIADIID